MDAIESRPLLRLAAQSVFGLTAIGLALSGCGQGDDLVDVTDSTSASSTTATTATTSAAETEQSTTMTSELSNDVAPVEGADSLVNGTIVHVDDVQQNREPVAGGSVHLLAVGTNERQDSVVDFEVEDGSFSGPAPQGEWTVCHQAASGFFSCGTVAVVIAGDAVHLDVVVGDGSMGASVEPASG